MEDKIYDVIIVGAGPAALTASIYATRYGLSNVVIGETPGGTAAEATMVHNWPGEKSIKGFDLMQKMLSQTQELGAQIIYDKVDSINKEGEVFTTKTSFSGDLQGKTIVIATGTQPKRLDIPGEKEFVGKGVVYCATCDGPMYKNKTVAVVGGGNSALGVALYLSTIAEKIFVIVRKNACRADQKTIDDATNNSKITFLYETQIKEIKGQGKVEEVTLSKPFENNENLKLDGVFIEVGSAPVKELVEKLGIETTEAGFIKINPDQSTNIAGAYAAGDCTNGMSMLKQIITASAAGAIAANSIYKFIRKSSI